MKIPSPARYAIYRVHLLERHVNGLYSLLKMQFPEQTETLDELLNDWQTEVRKMHDAFIRGDIA